MITKGLPDFGAGLVLADGPVWPSEGQGHWLAAATGLGLALDISGVPEFRVTLTRPAAPFLPPEPFGMLDLSVCVERDIATALDGLRAVHPHAALTSVGASRGCLRLGEAPEAPTLPHDLAAPVDLIWSEPGRARFARRLSIESAGLLEGMLSDGLLPVQVTGALGFDGISPRLPIEVQFDPGELLDALSSGTGVETRDALAMRIGSILSNLPIRVEPSQDRDDHTAIADALADRLIARFGIYSGEDPTGVAQFTLASNGGSGNFRWDLAAPFAATRWIPLQSDPFEALRKYLSVQGPTALVDRRTLSPIPVGTRLVRVAATLPKDSAGVELLGMTLTAPPWPPHRPRPAIASTILTPPDLDADLHLRLAPGEPLAYDVTCFSVLADASGVRRIEGPTRRFTEALLTLSPLDFGLRSLVLEASSDLLAHAALTGEVHSTTDGHAQKLTVALDNNQPRISVAVPTKDTEGQIRLRATAIDGGDTLDLAPFPLNSLRVDLELFPGYGPQTAHIRADIPTSGAIVVIDVIAETATEGTAVETLAFRQGQTERTWRYLSRSPFKPGFKWRKMGSDNVPGPWHHHIDPAQPLNLSA